MKKFFFAAIIAIILLPNLGQAQNVLGEETIFNIESSYDFSGRDELTATLIRISPTVYWYVDKQWWDGLTEASQGEVKQSLNSVVIEFEDRIYPNLTQTFGSEWTPGIDKDTRVTILIHSMKKDAGGYVNTSDEYLKEQIPKSNQREMLYLNSQYINDEIFKSFIAHEFVHLITFNQKEKKHNVTEETWLNEARAEYTPTLLGYDDGYEGSNLQSRVTDFLNKPSDSLTEWREAAPDYGIANLFIQYLVDHYGRSVLVDSLKTKKIGIESINAVLVEKGFKTDFSRIFADWALTVLINNCSVSEKYCYFNQNLKNIKIIPLTNYLPFVGDSILSIVNTTKDWAGNWHKFIGGGGKLKLEFGARDGAEFKVPYVIQEASGDFFVSSLTLDGNGKGEIIIENFGSESTSLTIIPIAHNKTSGFSNIEPSYSFFWSAVTQQEKEESPLLSLPPLTKPISQMTRSEILARIAEIKEVILALQKLLLEMEGGIACQNITQDLYFGMENNLQVKCLQEFLKSQGSNIYPEGITNGNFYTLTQKAVVRFQEKYASEILAPLGLTSGTGYIGGKTRAKINELLGQ